MINVADMRARVKARVWQAVALNNLAMADIAKDKLESLANDITDGVLVEMDALLEQIGAPVDLLPDQGAGVSAQAGTAATPVAVVAEDKGAKGERPAKGSTLPAQEDEEQILWKGRPFMSLVERYVVTTERVRIIRGMLTNDRDDIELLRLQDVDYRQTLGERILKIGDIFLKTHDPTLPEFTMRNIKEPEHVHEIIRRAMLNQRKKVNFGFREQM